jgi:hypothetical protein
MSLNVLNTNKRICFLNISANETIHSLFYNKSIQWPIFEFFDVKFMDGLFHSGKQYGWLLCNILYIYILYIHILPTLPTLCHCLLNNFIYLEIYSLHSQAFQEPFWPYSICDNTLPIIIDNLNLWWIQKHK